MRSGLLDEVGGPWWQGAQWTLARLLSDGVAAALDPLPVPVASAAKATASLAPTAPETLGPSAPVPASVPMTWSQLTIVRLRLVDASAIARAQPLAAALAEAVPESSLATLLLSALDDVAEPLRGYMRTPCYAVIPVADGTLSRIDT